MMISLPSFQQGLGYGLLIGLTTGLVSWVVKLCFGVFRHVAR
jgi:hypothetical protein